MLQKINDFLPKQLPESAVEEIYNILYEQIPLAGNLNQDPCNNNGEFYIEGGHYDSDDIMIGYSVRIMNNDKSLNVRVSFFLDDFGEIESKIYPVSDKDFQQKYLKLRNGFAKV